jgi:hypothetical protein
MSVVPESSLQYRCCKALASSIHTSQKGAGSLVLLRTYRHHASLANVPPHLVATILELLVKLLKKDCAQCYEMPAAKADLWTEALHTSCVLNGLTLSLRAISYVAPLPDGGDATLIALHANPCPE